jgi:hypothetical protein
MRWALVFVVVGACTDDVTFGQVQAIDNGDGKLEMRACLDAQLFSCDAKDVELSATNAASSGTLKYSGIFFPEHMGWMPLGARDADVVVVDGDARVVMTLPTAFELTSDVTGPLTSADTVNLRWSGADEPLVWRANGTCDTLPTYPSTGIYTTDDDGALTVTVARLEELMERSLVGCDVEIETSRVREGFVGDGFRADSATGIVRRTVTVMID